MSDTLVEFCLTRDQTTPLTVVIPDTGRASIACELLAEGMHRAREYWDQPECAFPRIIWRLSEFYDLAFFSTSRRHTSDDVIVVDFISKLVSDRSTGRSYKFKDWLGEYDVP